MLVLSLDRNYWILLVIVFAPSSVLYYWSTSQREISIRPPHTVRIVWRRLRHDANNSFSRSFLIRNSGIRLLQKVECNWDIREQVRNRYVNLTLIDSWLFQYHWQCLLSTLRFCDQCHSRDGTPTCIVHNLEVNRFNYPSCQDRFGWCRSKFETWS